MRRDSNFERMMVLIMLLGIIGSFIAGEMGAVTGVLMGIAVGIALWHRHKWKSIPLYDDRGKPVMMMKVCEICKETEFDGWFQREEN